MRRAPSKARVREYANNGYVVCLEGYLSVLLLSYSISSGALESPDLLLSYSTISLASHITIILTMVHLSTYFYLSLYIYKQTGTLTTPKGERIVRLWSTKSGSGLSLPAAVRIYLQVSLRFFDEGLRVYFSIFSILVQCVLFHVECCIR